MNRRVNITYSISEEEFGPELASLLEKAATYISDATQMLHDSVTALESRDYTNSLVCIAKMRDSLAFTDYRLHDTMTMVASYENALKQSSGLGAPPLPDDVNVSSAAHKIQNFEERLRAARENITKLGLQVPDDELRNMLEAADDSAS